MARPKSTSAATASSTGETKGIAWLLFFLRLPQNSDSLQTQPEETCLSLATPHESGLRGLQQSENWDSRSTAQTMAFSASSLF